MKMPYRDGFCPQCDEAIKIKDMHGRFSVLKSNHSQADMYFERNGSKLRARTLICKKCIQSPDLQVIFDAITNSGSQATTEEYRNMFKEFGPPVRIVECIR